MHTEANQDMQPGKPATDSQATGNVNDAATSNRARTDTIDQAHAAKNEFQMKLGSSDAGDGGGGALSSDFRPETCVADAAVEIPMKLELTSGNHRRRAAASEASPAHDAGRHIARRGRRVRSLGAGAMSPRQVGGDEPTPAREVIDSAANTARTTGHRFDLMRYLRLRRRS